MKENKNTTCDPCEQDFKRSVDELVREGKSPARAERSKRKDEVKAAFAEESAHHTSRQNMGMEGMRSMPEGEPAVPGSAKGKM